jgi:hypothetical protein
MAWSKDELQKIAEADDLHISPFPWGRGDVRHPDMDLFRNLAQTVDRLGRAVCQQ